MKYNGLYTPGNTFPYWDEIDEITIDYKETDTSLPEFLEQYKNKVINIRISKEQDLNKLILLHNKYTNFRLAFNYDQKLLEKILESNISFYFLDCATTWDTFLGFLQYQPTSILFLDSICFELDKVAKIAHANNVEVRVIPHIAQSSWDFSLDIKKFFIRPEDIDFYEPYVDICDFTVTLEGTLKTIYEVYAKDKHWFGQLKEIIMFFEDDIDNRRINSMFGFSRIGCGKKCLKGNPCSICTRTKELAERLGGNDLIFTPKKND